MTQRAIGPPVNIYVKEGKVAVSFRLHGELNVLVDKKVPHPVGAVRPADELVVHVPEPAEGLRATRSSAISSKCSMKKLAMTADSGETISTPSICS
jgi:hypothetical protein